MTIVSQSLLAKTRPILKLCLCVSENRDTAFLQIGTARTYIIFGREVPQENTEHKTINYPQ